MDIFARLEMLEDLVARARKLPLSSSVVINEAEFYDMLDDIRATLPGELKTARIITKEKERIIADAEREAQEIVERAQKEADRLVQETSIMEEARLERAHMLDEAQREAKQIVLEAEDYADNIFGELEAQLLDVSQSIDDILSRVRTWRERLRKLSDVEIEERYDYEVSEEE